MPKKISDENQNKINKKSKSKKNLSKPVVEKKAAKKVKIKVKTPAPSPDKVKKGKEEKPKEKSKKNKKKKSKKGFNLKRDLQHIKELLKGETKKQKQETVIYWGKKFTPLILFFLLYSFLLVIQINVGTMPQYIAWLTGGKPYTMGVALIFTFFAFMILFMNNSIKKFIFEKNSFIKQVVIFTSILVSNFLIWDYVINVLKINMMPFLFIAALFWLLFQGIRLYYDARGFATRTESKMLRKYSIVRFIFVIITPFFILIFLTTAVWAYRYFLVILTLDFLGVGVPQDGLQVYSMEMNLFLPFLYISLVSIFALITIEFILSLKQSDNKRMGIFDNFAYSLIVFSMFLYLLYQMSLYFVINDNFVTAMEHFAALFASDDSGLSIMSYIFIIEFFVSMLFLLRGIRNMSASLGGNFYAINQDGLIMGFFGFFLAQTTSRVAIFSSIESQTVGKLTNLLTLDHLIIPIIIILFLGFTILFYYIKPQEVSMFMRIAKESVSERDKAMEIILKFLKREFIRRGDRFKLDEVLPQLIAITELQKGIIVSLVKRLAEKYMDVQLYTETENDKSVRYIDFISVTEKYQQKKQAKAKAQKFMTNQLVNTLGKQKKRLTLTKDKITEDDDKGQFLLALGNGFRKKVVDERSKKSSYVQEAEKLQRDFSRDVSQDTRDVIYELIKKEYIYRVEHTGDYEDCRLKVSEIADKVFETTRISSGILYPLLGHMTDENHNLILVDITGDLNDVNDHLIDFNPIDDFEVSDALLRHRPEKLRLLKNNLNTLLYLSLTREYKNIDTYIKLDKPIMTAELMKMDIYSPKIFNTKLFWYYLMIYFNKEIKKVDKEIPWHRPYKELFDIVQEFRKKE